jgi:hypothetical protein
MLKIECVPRKNLPFVLDTNWVYRGEGVKVKPVVGFLTAGICRF